jgi:hypothetical protein
MSNRMTTGVLRGLIIAAVFTLTRTNDLRAQRVHESTIYLAGRSPTLQAMPVDRLHVLQVASRDGEATAWRKAGQISGGFLGASVVGLAAWSICDDPEGSDRRVKGDAGYTPNANTAYAIGSFVGSTLLVHLIGQGDGSRSSVLSTAIGSGLASIPLFLGRNEPYLPVLGVFLAAPLQAIGATIGYQRARRASRGA